MAAQTQERSAEKFFVKHNGTSENIGPGSYSVKIEFGKPKLDNQVAFEVQNPKMN